MILCVLSSIFIRRCLQNVVTLTPASLTRRSERNGNEKLCTYRRAECRVRGIISHHSEKIFKNLYEKLHFPASWMAVKLGIISLLMLVCHKWGTGLPSHNCQHLPEITSVGNGLIMFLQDHVLPSDVLWT